MKLEFFWEADLLCSQRCVQRQDVDAAGFVRMFALRRSCVYSGRPALRSPAAVPTQPHPLAHTFLHRRHRDDIDVCLIF